MEEVEKIHGRSVRSAGRTATFVLEDLDQLPSREMPRPVAVQVEDGANLARRHPTHPANVHHHPLEALLVDPELVVELAGVGGGLGDLLLEPAGDLLREAVEEKFATTDATSERKMTTDDDRRVSNDLRSKPDLLHLSVLL